MNVAKGLKAGVAAGVVDGASGGMGFGTCSGETDISSVDVFCCPSPIITEGDSISGLNPAMNTEGVPFDC